MWFSEKIVSSFSPEEMHILETRFSEGQTWLLLCSEEELRHELKGENVPVSGIHKTIRIQEFTLTEHHVRYEKFQQEFNRQIENLSKKGFPKLAGMDEKKFAIIFEPLKKQLKELSGKEFKEGRIPFVVVPREKLLSLEKEIPLMEVDGKKGFTTLNLSEFKTAEGVKIPESLAYLVIDVENGKVMLGKSADEAVKQLKKEGRSPMTAEEGVALILQHPEILKDHFMDLPGSRRGGVEVADLWLYEGRPGLDCHWAGSSLAEWGSASCGSRVGP